MDKNIAVNALAALAQPTRLEAFRALVRSEPDGVAAGALAALLEVPQNTLSAHLSILAQAQLVASERQGRSIVYRARFDQVRDLMMYLLMDCCAGRREVCTPIVAGLKSCCAPGRGRLSKELR